MKNKTLLAVLAAVSLAFSGLALAKGDDHGHGHQEHQEHQKHQKHQKHKKEKKDKHHGNMGRHGNGPPAHANAGGRGAGPDHNFYRGASLPAQYRDRGYWVEDWRGHRLSAPPAGYHWVQTGSDYVLVAPTNVIFQVVLGQ